MKKIHKGIFVGKRAVCLLSVLALLSGLSLTAFGQQAQAVASGSDDEMFVSYISYNEYMEKNASLPALSGEIVLNHTNLTSSSDEVSISSVYSRDNIIAFPKNTGEAEFTFEAEADGWYCIDITYCNMPLKMTEIEFSLSINGEIPFSQADLFSLPRLYTNNKITLDSLGNDLKSEKEEINTFRTTRLIDSSYVYENMKFYFKKGTNTLKIEAIRGGFGIESLCLTQAKSDISYEKYKNENAQKPNNTPKDFITKIQGELAVSVSDTILYPTYDKMNADTEISTGEKNSASKLKLNTIGQNTFNQAGQFINWEIEVPEDGFYNIGLRARQNLVRGFYSSRNIYIDDKILFKELKNVHFDYDFDWTIKMLGDEDPFEVYLTKGKHTITLEASAGDVGLILEQFDDCILELNTLYREIIMITGLSPDPYRDYNLKAQIPNLEGRFEKLAKTLKELAEQMKSKEIMKGNNAVAAQTVVIQLESFLKKPRTVALRISSFNDNISSLSSWVLSLKSQPLEIDYLFVKSSEVKAPKASSGFFNQLGFRVSSFVASFFEDYSLISDNEDIASIKVWIGTGRDQAQIVKDMVDNSFTPQTGINVALSLVQQGLLEAVASGRQPDIMLFTDSGTAINLAARGAILDLTGYERFNEIKKRAREDVFTQYEYEGGTYAFPLEQSFHMLFYRKDIFAQNGLSLPKTWDEFYYVLGRLQKKNLSVGVPVGSSTAPDISIFISLLFQNGADLYNKERTKTELNTEKSLKAFKQWTEFYTKYGLNVEFDFFTRFRSGEMPLGIQGYTFYNQLSIAAPEIAGLWAMAELPGTVDENGNIINTAVSGGNCAVILSKCKDEEAAYKFIDWFTDEPQQTQYGLTVENILGPGGRYAPANIESLENMNWTQKELVKIVSQRDSSKVMPIIPATYMINRNITNAFRKVVIGKENHRETIYKYSLTMDEEITKKRQELGLD